MQNKSVIVAMQKAGATVTNNAAKHNLLYTASFPNGKRLEWFNDSDKVNALARPYAYDDANQEQMCFFYYTITSALRAINR